MSCITISRDLIFKIFREIFYCQKMSHESAKKKKCELQNNAKKEKEQDNIMQQNNFTSLSSSHVSLAKFISQF